MNLLCNLDHMNMAMRAAPHQDPLAEMHPYLAGDCVGAGRRPVGLRFGLRAQLYCRDVVIGKPMCSLKGNASVAGGQRSASARYEGRFGSEEDAEVWTFRIVP
ncbi:MAG: hypothetical protein DMF61_11865 [Blastocatellia bacterium AA13]|nr:MAG: hypothetical protein DMF61_11865 [Blastocatellia bacterium AA13]